MRINIAIPVYDGKLPFQVVKCLLEEQLLATQVGDALSVTFLPSCSVPAHGRNRLVKTFMDSGYDRLVFLDADVTFEPGALLKIAHLPVAFVGGAYRFKRPSEEAYPIGWLPGDLYTDKNGLLEVETIPTGFSAFDRSVFERMAKHYGDRHYSSEKENLFCYFQMIFADRQMHSDDTYFCKEWRAMGEKVFLYPELTLTHWDQNIPYVGNIGKWLKSRPAKEIA